MPLTDLNVSPYFDDFDESKLFFKQLYRPERAVQARELTQIQTALQNQFGKIGHFIFKNGSPVLGGQQTIDLDYPFIKIESSFNGNDIVLEDFENGLILIGNESGAKARIVNRTEADSNDPNTIFAKYLTGDSVTDSIQSINVTNGGSGYTGTPSVSITGDGSGATAEAIVDLNTETVIAINITNPGTGYTTASVSISGGNGSGATAEANLNTTSSFIAGEQISTNSGNLNATIQSSGTPVGKGSAFSVSNGVYFINDGFVIALDQKLILDKYSNTPSGRVGFEIVETIVNSGDDSSLLDPSQGSPNENAPGADRLKIELKLKIIQASSIDDTKFIEIARFENGDLLKQVQYPVFSELEKNLARRTFDTLGNYTVRPFSLNLKNDPNDNDFLIGGLEPGKAFVRGFEHETIFTHNVPIRKGRDTQFVNGGDILAQYGNYVITDDGGADSEYPNEPMIGDFNITEMETVELHDQHYEDTNVTSQKTDGVSVVGTGEFSSASANFETDEVKPDDILEISVGADSGRYRVVSIEGPNDLIVTPNFSNGGTGQTFTVDSGIALDNPSTYAESKIGTANVKQIRYHSGSFANDNKYRLFLFNIKMESSNKFEDVESIVIPVDDQTTPVEFKSAANIDTEEGKKGGVGSGDARLFGNSFNSLVFPIENVPVQTLRDEIGNTDTSYTFKEVFKSVSFSNSEATISSGGSNQTFFGATGSPLSDTVKNENYILVVTDQGTSSFPKGTIIPMNDANGRTIEVISPGTSVVFNVNDGNVSLTATIVATVNIDETAEKVKTLNKNTKLNFTTPNTTPLSFDDLAISDIFKLKAVYDSEDGGTNAVTPSITFNSGGTGSFTVGEIVTGQTSGVSGEVISWDGGTFVLELITTDTFNAGETVIGEDSGAEWVVSSFSAGDTEISSRYKLDNGQRDNFYDHGKITLRSGQTGPTGRILVLIDYFSHSAGRGYFSVDSYTNINYEDIPTFTSPSTGNIFQLRDVVDFRPRKQDGGSVLQGIRIPNSNTNIQADYSFYLPRIDKIYLDKDRNFGVIEGISSINPEPPSMLSSAMHLYTLIIPPYTFKPNRVKVKFINNKRFTMKDIGELERRIDRMEYYTTLSLLEKDTKDLSILDDDGNDRFKNGILIDSFRGHSVGDVGDIDYACSIDFENKFLRPPFKQNQNELNYVSGSSTGVQKTGDLITLPYTSEEFISQTIASQSVNVNPYNVTNWIGTLDLDPPSDVWIDTDTRPDVLINLEGENDAWEFLGDIVNNEAQNAGWGTQWNDWQTHWTGTTLVDQQIVGGRRNRGNARGLFSLWNRLFQEQFQRSTFETEELQTRTGLQTTFAPETITTSIGDRVVDTSIIPFIRNRNVTINASGMKPNTRVFAFFDGIDVTSFCTPSGGSQGGAIYTDSSGDISNLTFSIPNSDTLRFRTGQRLFRLIDDVNNEVSTSTTSAEKMYQAQGLLQTREETIISTRVPGVQRDIVTEERVLTERFSDDRFIGTRQVGWIDPLAQTFLVDPNEYQNGLFLTKLKLYFSSKDSDGIPVTVQIRETVNGYPGQVIVPFSEVTLKPDNVNVSADASEATEFTFSSPVYLDSGEYSIVIISNSNEYEVFIAEMGNIIIGTADRRVSEQPYAGSLFKSQNASTWTADQNQDLTFELEKANFTIAGAHEAVFQNTNSGSDVKFDVMMLQTQNLQFNKSTIKWDFKATTESTGNIDSDWNSIIEGQNYYFDVQKKITTSLGSFLSRAVMNSSDENLSPVIDVKRMGVIVIENLINNLDTNEEASSGGDAIARYITRRVNLADGFESTDLRVILTAEKQSGTNIKVYYKVLSSFDPEPFDEKLWILMQQETDSALFSSARGDFKEYEFSPVTSPISYTANGAVYDNFKTFAIKIVMISNNTAVVPKAKDLRAIALL